MNKLVEKTLYHGTLIDNQNDIKRDGLIPTIGEFVKNTYAGSSDMSIEEYAEQLVFATDKTQLDKAVTAITAQVANKLKKSFHSVTDIEFLKHGMLVVVKDGDQFFEHRHEDDEKFSGSITVEPGDYYSYDTIYPDYYLTGNKLKQFLMKYKLFPRSYGLRESIDNECTVNFKKKYPHIKPILVNVKQFNQDIYKWYKNLSHPQDFQTIKYLKNKNIQSDLPPVILANYGNGLKILDGWHRIYSALINGEKQIYAYIEPNNLTEELDINRILNTTFYHGTEDKFNKFDLSHFGKSDSGWLGYGIYVTNDINYAKSYGKYLLTCMLKIKSPLILTDPNYSRNPSRLKLEYGCFNAKQLTQKLKHEGYDSVILMYSDSEVTGGTFIECCIFDPNDIKIIKNLKEDNQIDSLRPTIDQIINHIDLNKKKIKINRSNNGIFQTGIETAINNSSIKKAYVKYYKNKTGKYVSSIPFPFEKLNDKNKYFDKLNTIAKLFENHEDIYLNLISAKMIQLMDIILFDIYFNIKSNRGDVYKLIDDLKIPDLNDKSETIRFERLINDRDADLNLILFFSLTDNVGNIIRNYED